jgi:hypothetical protein
VLPARRRETGTARDPVSNQRCTRPLCFRRGNPTGSAGIARRRGPSAADAAGVAVSVVGHGDASALRAPDRWSCGPRPRRWVVRRHTPTPGRHSDSGWLADPRPSRHSPVAGGKGWLGDRPKTSSPRPVTTAFRRNPRHSGAPLGRPTAA